VDSLRNESQISAVPVPRRNIDLAIDIIPETFRRGVWGWEPPDIGLCDRKYPPHLASHRSNLTQESLRGGVPPFNGGTGGRNPQIRVLPTLEKPKPASIDRLPTRLLLIPEEGGHEAPPLQIYSANRNTNRTAISTTTTPLKWRMSIDKTTKHN
jgi:hypothetical protein